MKKSPLYCLLLSPPLPNLLFLQIFLSLFLVRSIHFHRKFPFTAPFDDCTTILRRGKAKYSRARTKKWYSLSRGRKNKEREKEKKKTLMTFLSLLLFFFFSSPSLSHSPFPLSRSPPFSTRPVIMLSLIHI